MNDDEEFAPRLGRIGGRGKEARYLALVVKATRRLGKGVAKRGRFDGSRIGRGASIARVLRSRSRESIRSRRVVVKFRLAKLAGSGLGGAKAHLRYIQRDGVTREGAPGALYSAERDIADGAAFLDRSGGDRHQFRIIVAPEDGDQFSDLKPFVRRLMTQMEEDLGTTLDWVAVDHFNTGHPHSHIMLRGKNDRGDDLVIAREYIGHGFRHRASDLLTLDLGPRTDIEIEARLRADVNAERLTAIDRQLLREATSRHLVMARNRDALQQTLRTGRLQKLARMGLAVHLGGDSWRLDRDLAATLRRMGERGDIIRTMQRELTARNLHRASADRVIFDPARPGAGAVTGRVIARGLSDEHRDHNYLLVDGVDGHTHYIEIGQAAGVPSTPEGAIVRISPCKGRVRGVDETIVEVADANGGTYTTDAHLLHDPTASEAFAEAHIRRLEAMRRMLRSVERNLDGSWVIAADHLQKVEEFERRMLAIRPVEVEILSAIPIDELPPMDAATWLDRELVAETPTAIREAGFGREVRAAQALRRQWLLAENLAEDRDGKTIYRRDLLKVLQRRELLRVAGQLANELGKPFIETKSGQNIAGRLLRPLDMASGRHAVIERARDFTLVPWRPILERHVGKPVSGIMRESGINWSVGRQRRGPSIS
ncbi:relaxase/mobilization nuclease RlxS [Sphingopyxis terrae]|uniref:Type IV secretory pathway, VirD2 components (Relaxase) n=1 Tax=Sphingopyxis terrae subsp. ummariensis TaxID=429001 RepID=A0A1Y6FNV7_9SPHN|nr:relaxase/mobilization nuclease RlxS [Sphingopyxis terrae]PCF90994.1 DUF3363 domain-containing protein [Sphingopyxis terrae subsp. ummariensis]SMQ76387.1 Type IV secretory pathway, VirD2 components (relaxase) [Sphingopyxis terrae subsp. ummariensis]